MYIIDKTTLIGYIKDLWDKKPNESWIGYTIAILTILVYLIKSLISNTIGFAAFDYISMTLFVVIMVILFIFAIKSFKKDQASKRINTDFANELQKISVPRNNTNLFIIKIKDLDKIKVLTTYNIDEGYWLPYTDEDPTEYLNKEFHFPCICKKIEFSSLDNILKKIPKTQKYTEITYTFYDVEFFIDINTFNKRLNPSSKKYSFISIDDMKQNTLTIKTNFDIISALERINLNSFSSSFGKDKTHEKLKNLKVIWNITKSCQHGCTFCATNATNTQSSELSFEDRIKILEEIKKIENVTLDIAGGDPLYDKEVVKFLKHATKYMLSNITITTTGSAINNFSGNNINNLQELSDEYDISFDYPHTFTSGHHRGNSYNKENYEYIKLLLDNGLKVNVLVTLSEYNINETDKINQMITELRDINPTSITLLRLMPVGKQDYNSYPKDKNKYNPLSAIELFKKELNDKIKLHCAFRANMNDTNNNYCNMLKEKLGVDNLGNLYSCAWAGYLGIDTTENPFYLGNLLNDTITDIFSSEKLVKIFNEMEQYEKIQHCPIFSFLENKESYLCQKSNDKLYEWAKA